MSCGLLCVRSRSGSMTGLNEVSPRLMTTKVLNIYILNIYQSIKHIYIYMKRQIKYSKEYESDITKNFNLHISSLSCMLP